MTDFVYLDREGARRPLRLGKLLGEGAAGKVYSLPELPGVAAKLYHDGAQCRRHEAKVDAMLAGPPDLPPALHEGQRYPQIAWPEAKLTDRGGRFIGFAMPEIDFRRSTSLVNMLQKNSRRVEKLSDYYGYRVLVARNLACVFAELHRAGHHMIDMKPANLRFYPAVSWMAVVDTDGFSIAGAQQRLPANVVSDEYIAPESWQQRPEALGLEQDRFALAVIIFQLLNNGVHPFAGGSGGGGAQATDLQGRIVAGLYPYAVRPARELAPSTASVHRMFRRATRALFDRTFVPGGGRPSAEEWRDHLDQLIAQLVPCAAKPTEHAHFGVGCGFCAHEARVEAARTAAQRRLPDRAAPRRPSPLVVQRRHPGYATARPVPRLAPVRPPPPRARRKRGLLRAWPLMLLLGLTGLASGEIRQAFALQDLFGLRPASVSAMAAPAPLPASLAPIATFGEARGYLVLPRGGALAVPLRDGPGVEFGVVDELGLHEDVIGRGHSAGGDGENWIWVMRERDGASGFVPENALIRRSDGLQPALAVEAQCALLPDAYDRTACLSPALARSEDALQRQFDLMIADAQGIDREFLAEGKRLWEEQRARCAYSSDPIDCRRVVSATRMGDLESWARATATTEMAEMAPLPPLSLTELR